MQKPRNISLLCRGFECAASRSTVKHTRLSHVVNKTLNVSAYLRTFLLTVGELAGDELQHFIYEDNWEGELEHGEPLLEVKRRDLENALQHQTKGTPINQCINVKTSLNICTYVPFVCKCINVHMYGCMYA